MEPTRPSRLPNPAKIHHLLHQLLWDVVHHHREQAANPRTYNPPLDLTFHRLFLAIGNRSPSPKDFLQQAKDLLLQKIFSSKLKISFSKRLSAIGNRSPSPKDFLQQAKDCGDDFCILAGHLSRQQFTLKAIVSPDLTKQQVTLKGIVLRDFFKTFSPI